MRPWVERVTYPAFALQYIGDIVLNLFIAGSGIVLLMLGMFLFS
jgi:hypothetical protein